MPLFKKRLTTNFLLNLIISNIQLSVNLINTQYSYLNNYTLTSFRFFSRSINKQTHYSLFRERNEPEFLELFPYPPTPYHPVNK